MKYLFGIFLSLILVNGVYAKSVTVGTIVDGDTFFAEVSSDENPIGVYLVNVDAPELNGKCQSEKDLAITAKQRLEELLPAGSVVEVKNAKETGKCHKRIRGNVILSDGRDVGEILIKENLGHSFDGVHRYSWCK